MELVFLMYLFAVIHFLLGSQDDGDSLLFLTRVFKSAVEPETFKVNTEFWTVQKKTQNIIEN